MGFLFYSNMEIVTHKKTKHIGCPIYIRRINTTFEYLTVIRGEIYSQLVIFKPTLTGRLMHAVGAWKTPYIKKHLQSSIFYLIAMAEATIETILDVDETGKKNKKIKVTHITDSDVEKLEAENNKK